MKERRRIGKLSPSFQAAIRDLGIGEEVTLDNSGTPHASKRHGFHGDAYLIKKISSDEVEIEKVHLNT